MSIVLLIVFICTSFLVVRIGAIALEMTGMEKSMARFQALSAFSGTGFTTREAERVVNHPRRRRIVTYLIILGNAGIVSVIATFVLSFSKSGFFQPSLNLVIILVSLLILYRIATHQRLAKKLTEKTKETLRKKFHFEKVHIEEILSQAEGYGVASMLVGKESKLHGLTLSESGLRDADLLILSIERDDDLITVPRAHTRIHPGDRLLCYGKLANMKEFA
jgi:hypothetical protein